MKTTKIFLMAALALMTVACSNDDNDIQTPAEQPSKAQGIPFTATISMGESASTRALTEKGTTIVATWADNEEVALIYTVGSTTYVKKAAVTPQGDGTATISTTLDGSPVDDTDVTIVYPASAVDESTKDVKTGLLDLQNGLLTGTGSIAEKYELRKTTTPAKLKIDGSTASLKGTVTLTNLIAIFKFTLQDLSAAAKSATEFKVIANSGYVITTVKPVPASDVLYVALPAMGDGTFWFNATIDNKPYIAKATMAVATEAGKYYQTTVKMATIGDVILADGTFAAPTSTGVAMIAYLGNGSDCTHGLAIQLNASPASMDWSGACNYSSYPSITGNPGTWRLPSKADWQNMFVGCAKSGDAISPDGDGKMDPIAGFKEKIGATGITWQSNPYWSSTDSGSRVDVALGVSYANALFNGHATTSAPFYVLGCLAF